MKKLLIPAIIGLALVAAALGGCGKTPQGSTTGGGGGCSNGTVDMTDINFAIHTCTIKAGSKLTLTDPTAGGGIHFICFGTNQKCAANADGPTELNSTGNGVQFNPGDSKSYTFAKAGTYQITCTVHPAMDLTLTVQ
jgi:plastocyanin